MVDYKKEKKWKIWKRRSAGRCLFFLERAVEGTTEKEEKEKKRGEKQEKKKDGIGVVKGIRISIIVGRKAGVGFSR